MSVPLSWADLVPRLERDLRSRKDLTGTTDEAAWYEAAHLLRLHARMISRSHVIVRAQDIEDVVQDVLVKLQSLETMRRLRAAGSPSGYIAVMMRNALLDTLRRNVRERERFLSTDGLPLAGPAEGARLEITSGPKTLWEMLHKLSSDDRRLLSMRFWQDLSLKEIAKGLEISYSAAAVRSFRALKKVRQLLEEQRKLSGSK